MSLSSLVGQIRCATNEQQPRQRQRQRADNGKEGLGTHVGLRPAPQQSRTLRRGPLRLRLRLWLGDWEHGANVTNMGMKCASDKSNILTNFHVAAPHYHPEKGVEQRPPGKAGRGGREQWVATVETTSVRSSHCSTGICVFKCMLMMQHTPSAASPGSTMETVSNDDFQFSVFVFLSLSFPLFSSSLFLSIQLAKRISCYLLTWLFLF